MSGGTGPSRRGQPVSLRHVEAADCDLIFAWQSEPGARRFSRNPDAPSRSDHDAWFARRTTRRDEPFYVIRQGEVDAGFIRADAHAPGAEVSLLVASAHQGLGVATAAIRLLAERHPDLYLYAHVVEANEASRRAFLAASFSAEGPETFVRRPIRRATEGVAD